MATLTTTLTMVRALIGDDGATQTYTDAQLRTMVSVGLLRLGTRLGFTYEVSGSDYSPSDPNGRDTDLIVLQTCCLLGKRKTNELSQTAVTINTDGHEIGTGSAASAMEKVAQDFCEMLEEAISQYLSNPNVEVESVVSECAEIIWAGNSNNYEDVTFNGDESDTLYSPGRGDSRSKSKLDRTGR